MGTVFLMRDRIGLTQVGYGGVALAALVASAGLIIPVPALAAVCTASLFLNPLLVGVIAAVSESVGELSGYFLGYSGRGVIHNSRLYIRLEAWMRRRGWLVLFLVSLVPNPVFDVVGIVAGALRYPILGFLGIILAGKLVKFIVIAYACAFSIEWLTDFLGL